MSNFYVVDDQSRHFAVLQSETLFLVGEVQGFQSSFVEKDSNASSTTNLIILSNIGS